MSERIDDQTFKANGYDSAQNDNFSFASHIYHTTNNENLLFSPDKVIHSKNTLTLRQLIRRHRRKIKAVQRLIKTGNASTKKSGNSTVNREWCLGHLLRSQLSTR